MSARGGWLLLLAFGCAPIVGITDTEVEQTNAGGKAGTGGSGLTAGSAGSVAASGGSSTAGTGGKATGGGGSTALGGSGGVLVAGAAGSVTAGTTSAGAGGSLGGNAGAANAGTAGITAGAGGSDACPAGTSRCTASGRQTCTAGSWQTAACPPNEPTCEGEGECIVRGPTMVAVDDYFIDSTEVTVAQYGEFLEAKGSDTSGQPSVCSWNTAYYDDEELDPPNFPMARVDWCDARAFCEWAGKRLCGNIQGGAIARADLFAADSSQWARACGGPSGAEHPRPGAVCNANDGFEDVAEVATFPDCEGYYPGLFDMEANVAEWVDSCEGSEGATDICYLAGGSIFDDPASCKHVYDTFPRDETAVSFGIRCCSL